MTYVRLGMPQTDCDCLNSEILNDYFATAEPSSPPNDGFFNCLETTMDGFCGSKIVKRWVGMTAAVQGSRSG